MRRALGALLAAALLCAAAPGIARAEFGFVPDSLDVRFPANAEGSSEMAAGSHPFAMEVSFEANTRELESGKFVPDGEFRDLITTLPEGLVGSNSPVPRCAAADFLPSGFEVQPDCADSSAIGVAEVGLSSAPASPGEPGEGWLDRPGLVQTVPVYLLEPSPGAAAKLGFVVTGVPITVEARLATSPPYNIRSFATNIAQAVLFFGVRLTLWGVPADPVHDDERGSCAGEGGGGGCEAGIAPKPFLTLPRSCEGPLETLFEARSWQAPGVWERASAETHNGEVPPAPLGPSGCARLGLSPDLSAQPTNRSAAGPTGLDFDLSLDTAGLLNPTGAADSDVKQVEVTLPKGMTLNPSQAEGLEVCSEEQLAAERLDSGPGEGCPEAAKIGTIEVESPLLEDEVLKGALYVAEPYRNLAGDSLIAVYVVIKDRELGIKVTQPLRVEPDPATGRLVTYSEDMPQLPFSAFRLHFREGGRSPLITPPGCGAYEVTARLTPFSDPDQSVPVGSRFEIVSGPGGGPCPPAGAAPFAPGFEAGTINNAAGAYSPFLMRLTRADGMQDLTKFAATLPPGVVGKIGGVPYCPEAGIARARSRTGQNGGTAELGDPSCPAASQIGRTVGGAGVGSQLTYVPGSLYLAGPYNGAPLSVVSITPAVAGPFDAGVVVVRVALDLDPVTAEVSADGSASDPIPHILQGIPLNVRDLRVYVDRPEFTLNATSCEESQTRATLFGGGTVLAPTADTPVARSARYQAAGCASLGFKPRLGIKLRGGTRRGGHPGLRAVVTPRPGDANFSRAVVKLPTSAFLDQAHIRTICTRVQFASGAGHGSQCPKGAQYGYARAWSPLLDEPLQGPVFLRSSNNNLPDLVVALKGLVDIELAARIDSVKGGIRSTFPAIPDAPVSRFILNMQGGKKGLIVNSRNLCRKAKRNRAKSNIRGQNGKLARTKPVVRAVACGKKRKAKRSSHRRARVARASAVR